MKIIKCDPVFDSNLESHMFSRRAIVLSLMRSIEDAPNIHGLKNVVACPEFDGYFVHDNICWLFFELLEGDDIKLWGFRFDT